MQSMARWCFRRRRRVVTAWVLALAVVALVSQSIGPKYNDSLALPNTDSQAAVNLLKKNFNSASGESDQVVVQATGGMTVHDSQVQKPVTTALNKVAKLPGISSVASPYSKSGSGQISANKKTAYASVEWSKSDQNISKSQAQRVVEVAQSADGSHVHISLGGQAIEKTENAASSSSVAIAAVAALIVLLIVFGGALAAAVMPLLTAGLALFMAICGVGLISHVMEVPDSATSVAILIGLGVGVDYGLFVISRYRSGLKSGLANDDAIAQALNTSGRTVLFAGATVCIALLGQLALGVEFLDGLSVASAVAVALTMAASLTFLPAMMGFIGKRALSRHERKALSRSASATDVSRMWLRWARVIENHKVLLAPMALAIVVIIALPIFSLRLDSPDAGTDPASSTTRQAFDALANGFGPGFNGPLQLAGHISDSADSNAFNQLLNAAKSVPGVKSVSVAQTSSNGKAVLASIVPTTRPQAQQTTDLVNRLRDHTIPLTAQGTSLQVHVGGQTATNIDFAHTLTNKLPIFIALVVIVAFILLVAVFRSLLIPLTASIMNLLSIGATLGAVNAVFNLGWGHTALGVPGTGPVNPFLPVLMFSVLFGLSMDYEVYLVSRMQEEEFRPRTRGKAAREQQVELNHEAIVTGQAKSGRIIAAAATVMILVFASFLLGDNLIIKTFGFGLAFAVLIDAFVIRSVLVPSIMHLTGPKNWEMPRWLDRIIPNLSIESN